MNPLNRTWRLRELVKTLDRLICRMNVLQKSFEVELSRYALNRRWPSECQEREPEQNE